MTFACPLGDIAGDGAISGFAPGIFFFFARDTGLEFSNWQARRLPLNAIRLITREQ
jgi:hypothetical protein